MSGAAYCDEFDDGGIGLATALAHRLQAVPEVSAAHVEDHVGEDAGTGTPERVTESDRTTVGVELVLGCADLLPPRHGHRSERLVDLEDADVLVGPRPVVPGSQAGCGEFRSSPTARAISARGAGSPVNCSTCPKAWFRSMCRPLTTRTPRASAAVASGVGQGS